MIFSAAQHKKHGALLKTKQCTVRIISVHTLAHKRAPRLGSLDIHLANFALSDGEGNAEVDVVAATQGNHGLHELTHAVV